MTCEQLEATTVDRKVQFSTVVMLVARVKKAKNFQKIFTKMLTYQEENPEADFDAKRR